MMDFQAKILMLSSITNLRLVYDFESITELVENVIFSIKLESKKNSLNNLDRKGPTRNMRARHTRHMIRLRQ